MTRDDDKPSVPEIETVLPRRKLAKVLVATGAVTALDQLVPVSWSRPWVSIGGLPAHAALSGAGGAGGGAGGNGGMGDGGAGGGQGGGGGAGGSAQPVCESDAPNDLDPMAGDPALEIVSTCSAQDGLSAWVRVEFAGGWPPPDVYSWYAKIVLLDGGGMIIGSVTTQLHDGVTSTFSEGGVERGTYQLVVEPNGLRVMFNGSVAHPRYGVESGILKTMMGGTFVQDFAGPFDFNYDQAPFAD